MGSFSFRKFLKHHQKEYSTIGTFSRIVANDRSLPRNSKKEKWLSYLKSYKPSELLLSDFERCWDIYKITKDENDLSEVTNLYIPNGNEKKSSIELLKIPNYWHGSDNSEQPLMLQILHPKAGNKQHDIYIKNQISKPPIIINKSLCENISLYGSYFKQELHFDFHPYHISAHEKKGNSVVHPYILPGQNRYSGEENFLNQIGVCVFEYDKKRQTWTLEWVWMHPFYRNRGHFGELWSRFKNMYGKFQVSQPRSMAMTGFLNSKNYNEFS